MQCSVLGVAFFVLDTPFGAPFRGGRPVLGGQWFPHWQKSSFVF